MFADFRQKAKQNSNLGEKESPGGEGSLRLPDYPLPPGGSFQTAVQERGGPDRVQQPHCGEDTQITEQIGLQGGQGNQNVQVVYQK